MPPLWCSMPLPQNFCSPSRKKYVFLSLEARLYWSYYIGSFFFFFALYVLARASFLYPPVLSYLLTHSLGFVVKLCIKVNVKTQKMCNLQGVSFYSLLQWRLSTTVSQPGLRSAWKLMCSAGPHQAYPLSPSPALPLVSLSLPPCTHLLHRLFPGQDSDRYTCLPVSLWDLPSLWRQAEICQVPPDAGVIKLTDRKTRDGH